MSCNVPNLRKSKGFRPAPAFAMGRAAIKLGANGMMKALALARPGRALPDQSNAGLSTNQNQNSDAYSRPELFSF